MKDNETNFAKSKLRGINGNGAVNGNGYANGNGNGFVNGNGAVNGNGYYNGIVDPISALADAIGGGGVPGVDYPILASVPFTGFSCGGLIPGYYADTAPEAGCQLSAESYAAPEAGCQLSLMLPLRPAVNRVFLQFLSLVFHICQADGRSDSFLCPNGTIFNQQYFVCDWWYNFDCSTASQFYDLNALIGVVNGNGNGYTYGVNGVNGASNGNGNGYTNGNGNGLTNGNGNGLTNGNGNGNGYTNGKGNGNGLTNGNGNGLTNGNGYTNGNGNGLANGNGYTNGNGNGLAN
ncbi:U-scoloptoxin(01)-Er1a-like 16, partial [Homarus americanus]